MIIDSFDCVFKLISVARPCIYTPTHAALSGVYPFAKNP